MKIYKIAGWWQIKDVDSGQIKWDQADKKDGLINALPNQDDKNKLYNGDAPADIMGAAFKDIIGQYEENWDRKPTLRELQSVFNFCFNAADTNYGLKK